MTYECKVYEAHGLDGVATAGRPYVAMMFEVLDGADCSWLPPDERVGEKRVLAMAGAFATRDEAEASCRRFAAKAVK